MKTLKIIKPLLIAVFMILISVISLSCKKQLSQSEISFDIAESKDWLDNKIATNSNIRHEDKTRTSYNIESLLDSNFKYIIDYSNDSSIYDIDSVKFGKYDLDDDNTKEDLEWVALTSNGKYALLLSKYMIKEMPMISYEELNELEHNDKFALHSIRYNDCAIRKWLNNDFLINAFNEEEKKLIEESYISANNNPYNGLSGGCWTLNDKLFLLSIEDSSIYFGIIGGTKKNTCYINEDSGWWWLRSMGDQTDTMTVVDNSLTSLFGVSFTKYYFAGVRPAFWINLELLRTMIKSEDNSKYKSNSNIWFKNDLGQWFYYIGEKAELKKGLMTDKRDGQIYYFDPVTGVMKTGYVEIDGVQYYFNETNENRDNWYQVGNGYYECNGRQVKALGSLVFDETIMYNNRIKDNWTYRY